MTDQTKDRKVPLKLVEGMPVDKPHRSPKNQFKDSSESMVSYVSRLPKSEVDSRLKRFDALLKHFGLKQPA